MHIELVSTAIEKDNLSYPLGALCIQTALEHTPQLSDCSVNTSLFCLADEPEKAAKQILVKHPDGIGFSIYLWNRKWFSSFHETLKKSNYKGWLFAGGTEISANYSNFRKDGFDFLVVGEGEESTPAALVQLKEGKKPEGKGIYTQECTVPSFASIRNLESLDSPLLTHTADPFLFPGCSILWEMTRGCPYHCAFCFESKGLRSVRDYPMARTEAELDYIVSKGVADVFVLDPTFNINKERTLHILHMIRDKAPDVHFTFELRAELLDKDLVEAFSQIYCSLQIGLQSIHKDVLEAADRKFDRKLFEEKVRMLVKSGIVFGLDLIIGLPGDTLEKFKESLNFATGLQPSNLDIFPLSLLPGTKLAHEAAKLGLEVSDDDTYTIRCTSTLSPAELQEAMVIKHGCDEFYTKGGASMFLHTVLEATGLTASQLFKEFALFIEHRNKEEDIYGQQELFIRQLLKDCKDTEIEDAVISFVELHQGIDYLMDCKEEPEVSLRYDPNELALLDKMAVKDFVRTHRSQQPAYYLITETENGIEFFRLTD
jgi:radical SAM superfamily enzyme YgiQ (UPF0313 family)